ncbi:MAG: hypothetical protein KDJ65_11765 [Anaerolineae bacterium]|nr:hypothetical protein [Anaerolineae bacterium]
MYFEKIDVDVRSMTDDLAQDIISGNSQASRTLAKLIEADTQGVFQPFAEAFAARLSDHIKRWVELGVPEANVALDEAVYQLLKMTAIDWDGYPSTGRPGEES